MHICTDICTHSTQGVLLEVALLDTHTVALRFPCNYEMGSSRFRELGVHAYMY